MRRTAACGTGRSSALARDLLGLVPVMRDVVVRFGNADLGIRPQAQLARELERHHARHVRAKRQVHQVHHQLRVVVEERRNPERLLEAVEGWRRRASRSAGSGARRRAPRRGIRPSSGDRRDRRSRCSRASAPSPHRGCCDPGASCASRAAPVPPSPNSRSNTTAGFVSIGSGRSGAAHDERVDVRAAVAALAAAHGEVGLERELQRAQRRVLAEHVGGKLIGGPPGAQVGAFGRASRARRSTSSRSCASADRCRHPPDRPATLASPLTIVSWSRNVSSGRRIGVISNASPAVGGMRSFTITAVRQVDRRRTA